MKNKISILISSFLLLFIVSCKKEESKIYYEGGTPPALTASTSSVTLEPGQEANTAIALNWTNPEYKFSNGANSLDVTYTLEMDTLGANFSSSKKYTTVIAKDLAKTYTVAELNGILGNTMLLQLNPRRNYSMQIRIIASIGSGAKLASNVISFTTKPFSPPPKITPPSQGTLYIVGSAVNGGWNNPIASGNISSQKFTKVSNTFYTITIPLIGNGEYKLIGINDGSWTEQWSTAVKDDPNKLYGGDFVFNGENVQAPPQSGTYKIDVDFQLGKFTVVKQ